MYYNFFSNHIWSLLLCSPIILERGFTATPVRYWAALYGVGCLSVRAAKAVSLFVSRPPSRHVCFMSREAARSWRTTSPITGVCPNRIVKKLVFHWSSLAERPIILQYILKKSQQNSSPGIGVIVPRYRRCATGSSDPRLRSHTWG